MRRIFALALLVCFLTSCASSRRLSRVFKENALQSEKKADRTNLFPVYYQSGESTSVLWPIMDKDNRGFALRPIYNQEDNEYSVLFPLTAWNPVAGDGWIGPYFWNEDFSALFPLYFKDEDGFQFLTYYNFSKNQGFFPLYSIYRSRENSVDWSFPMILPLVSHSSNETRSKTKGLYGLLYSNYRSEFKKSGSVLGVLASWKSSENSSRFRMPAIFNMTGLIDISEIGETSKVNLLLYSHEKSPTMTRRDIFPFITWDSGQNESEFSFLWRVFEVHERPEGRGGHIFFIPWGA